MKRIGLLLIAAVLMFSFSTSVSAAEDTKKTCDYDFYSLNDILFYDPCDNTCSTAAGTVSTLTGADNREKIFNYLKAKGLTPEQAAGVTGNIQNESGFSPSRQETSQSFPNGGWGLVQWTFGRRSDASPEKGVVAYLNSKIPEVMATYYSNAYGGGVSEAGGFVPTGMPVDANDKLLLNELDFLYKESTSRVISSSRTVSHTEGTTIGDNEWESLKKQTSIEKASNLWVYNFEIPGNIDSTAAERVKSGQAVFDKYSSGAATASAEECGALTGSIREKVVQAAEKEYAAWQSGQKKTGGDYLQYTYNVAGEWCAWFVSWVYKEAGYPVNDKAQPYYAVVRELMELGKKGDKFEWHQNDGSYTPQPGDIAVYGTASNLYHTNIVISATSPTVMTTIGGNEGHGDGVSGKENSQVKKSENSTYWPKEAYGYVSPKG